MAVVYTAVRRFTPENGDAWRSFIDWSGLSQLQEVLSLDGILCPTVIKELTVEDWQHNVQEDFKTTLFHDLEYLLLRVAGEQRVNILAMLQNPTANEVRSFSDARFEFRGFDLVEVQGEISALVNCGGFDQAFSRADLSEYGLLTDHAQALRVRAQLRAEYPNHRHGNCDVWAIWQLRTLPDSASV